MKRHRPPRSRRRAAEPPPPDPAAVRRIWDAAEIELDNAALARLRAEIDAELAAAMEPPPRPSTPPAPPPSSPILVVGVRRVVGATPYAILVEAWEQRIWIPKACIHRTHLDDLMLGWSGCLEISSWWAHSVGLPPTPSPATGRPVKEPHNA